jgi:integrase
VFDRGDGAHLDRSVIARRLARLCEQHDIPVLTPHGLRHTVTTIMVTNGAPLKVMADRLGHGSTRMTEAIYAHATAESDRRASETLSRLLRPDSGS